jgi:predicted site-specific integrase-resolvase|tara:strand:+ start:2452 stop:2727 length:276 start_codon:yes stop_codon:yes gene_type:complete
MNAEAKVSGVTLTEVEIAERMQVSPYTVQKWRQDGYGPPYVRLRNNAPRYPEDLFLEWLELQSVTSVTEERIRNNKAGVESFPGTAAGGYQ